MKKLRKANLPLTAPEQFMDGTPADLPGAKGSNQLLFSLNKQNRISIHLQNGIEIQYKTA